MTDQLPRMKSIWYLVGMMLLAMGAVITATGIYLAVNPPAVHTVLGETQPDLWWGVVMLAAGAAFFFGGRNRKHEA